MNYRKLGVTGLTVSEIGFGTIPILSGDVPVLPDYYSPTLEKAVNIMNYAYHLGCNLFDTAIVPEYGDAEIKLGVFAKSLGKERNKIIISDKARFYTGNEMYDAVLYSIKNLGTYPDIYFVHQVDFESANTVFGKYGAVEALTQLKLEGKIKFVGIASHYYDILLRGAMDSRVDVLQGSGNILERGMLDRIKCESLFSKKGLLINKVYAAGILPKFFSTEELIKGVLSYPISSALIGIGTMEEAKIALATDIPNNSSNLYSNNDVVSNNSSNLYPNNNVVLNNSTNLYPNNNVVSDNSTNLYYNNDIISNSSTNLYPNNNVVSDNSTNLYPNNDVVSNNNTNLYPNNDVVSNNIKSFSNVVSVLNQYFTPIPCDRCQKCICPYEIEIHTLFRQYNYFFLGKNYWALRKLDMGIVESLEKCRHCYHISCVKKCPKGINIPKEIEKIKELVEVHIRNSII